MKIIVGVDPGISTGIAIACVHIDEKPIRVRFVYKGVLKAYSWKEACGLREVGGTSTRILIEKPLKSGSTQSWDSYANAIWMERVLDFNPKVSKVVWRQNVARKIYPVNLGKSTHINDAASHITSYIAQLKSYDGFKELGEHTADDFKLRTDFLSDVLEEIYVKYEI